MVDNILEVNDLKTYYFTDEGIVKSVDGATFSVPRGKTVCIVGESGCGKSVTARSILQLIDRPGRVVEGEILFSPTPGVTVDIAKLDPRGKDLRKIRGKEISMIFQEPMSSLSPVHTIGDQIVEAVRLHFPVTYKEAKKRAIEALGHVGIPKPTSRFDSYIFELSGGMRQRAMIAMALVCRPKLLIADEPTTALDVTTQANILDLISDLQKEFGMTVLFITHDLGVVAEIGDEVIVMYLGKVAERADIDSAFYNAKHPYTQALLKSIPKIGQSRGKELESIEGLVPHPLNRPAGCPFHTRCTKFMPGVCDFHEPALTAFRDRHEAKCFLYQEAKPAHKTGVA
jgi:oligopeptide/dipeptide ABC transporter ATP-binding protein